jgi:hypothetical protein
MMANGPPRRKRGEARDVRERAAPAGLGRPSGARVRGGARTSAEGHSGEGVATSEEKPRLRGTYSPAALHSIAPRAVQPSPTRWVLLPSRGPQLRRPDIRMLGVEGVEHLSQHSHENIPMTTLCWLDTSSSSFSAT